MSTPRKAAALSRSAYEAEREEFMMNTTRDQLLEYSPQLNYDRHSLIETKKEKKNANKSRVRTWVCALSVLFAFVLALILGFVGAHFFDHTVMQYVNRLIQEVNGQPQKSTQNATFATSLSLRCALEKQLLSIEPPVEKCGNLSQFVFDKCQDRNHCQLDLNEFYGQYSSVTTQDRDSCASSFLSLGYKCKCK
jgi:hypothetical protein